MGYDKDRIKNSLSIDDIYSVLEELNANPTQSGNMIVSDTICHNLPGEGSHKLYYYDNTKLFKCYTGCQDYFDIYELVVKAYEVQFGEEWSLSKSVGYIANKFGFSSVEEDGFEEYRSEDWKYIKEFERLKESKEQKKIELNFYKDDVLKSMSKPQIKPWLDEGISQQTLDRFEISYYPKECQIVIPHRDIESNLIGIRGRTMVKEEGEKYGKYRPIKVSGNLYNHPLGFALYGLNLNKENIKNIKKAIVFEGEKSVMLYDTYFGSENNISVACCGSSISNHQFDLLKSLGVQEVVIAFDRQFKERGDVEFKQYIHNIKKMGDKYKNFLTVSCMIDKKDRLPYKASPIDCGRDTFIKIFKERTKI